MRLTLTTNPGLEASVRAEITERLAASPLAERTWAVAPSPAKGRVPVTIDAGADELVPLVLNLRSIHHVIRDVEQFPLPADDPLTGIRTQLAGLDIPGLDATTPFRITSVRSGDHEFSSMDVQAAAGAGVVARSAAPVDLRGYACHVQVDVLDDTVFVGLRWSEHPLSRRFRRPYERRVALAANVAYAMLRLAMPDGLGGRLLDPCCGTGTILLEAGAIAPTVQLVAGDSDTRSVAGCAQNLAYYGLSDRAQTRRTDARQLTELSDLGPFDAIVTNPPFGRRLGQRIDFHRFYRELLAGAREIISPGGRLVLLADKRNAFNSACHQAGGWHIQDVRIIELGGIHPGIFVLTATA